MSATVLELSPLAANSSWSSSLLRSFALLYNRAATIVRSFVLSRLHDLGIDIAHCSLARPNSVLGDRDIHGTANRERESSNQAKREANVFFQTKEIVFRAQKHSCGHHSFAHKDFWAFFSKISVTDLEEKFLLTQQLALNYPGGAESTNVFR